MTEISSLNFEELLDNMEILNLVKRYPSETREIKSQNLKEGLSLKLLRKLPLYKLNEKTADYAYELQKYTEECIKENKPLDKRELLDILSPLEGYPEIDNATLARIEPVFYLLQKTINEQIENLHMINESVEGK